MKIHLHKEIDKLKRNILHLTTLVEESVQTAVRSVMRRDTELAEQVIGADAEIDRMEVELEEECLKVLALHQPVAIDLRFVVAILKINSDLERIADLAVNIAERTNRLAGEQNNDVPFDLREMLKLTLAMVQKSADALVNMDTDLAREVCRSDDEVDDHHREAYDAVERQVRTRPEAAGYYITLLGISRNLERIADHATNIAEDVIYMVDGDIIRHGGG